MNIGKEEKLIVVEPLVTMAQVRQYTIRGQVFSEDEAQALWAELTRLLEKPQFEYKGCDDRYSHALHVWTTSGGKHYVCSGRSFDAT